MRMAANLSLLLTRLERLRGVQATAREDVALLLAALIAIGVAIWAATRGGPGESAKH